MVTGNEPFVVIYVFKFFFKEKFLFLVSTNKINILLTILLQVKKYRQFFIDLYINGLKKYFKPRFSPVGSNYNILQIYPSNSFQDKRTSLLKNLRL